ncbi:LysR family transcriptional regulator [Paraglaciecola sp. MB-3u-78]|uniref:LysR family transcriptional regulator n=1 Tax=Paraglaciecola sp. MB-3u-78 TaxID=2058332 RepID=UPI0021078809|nr:LysR family transcriptional regulator [Paraglaciecola sp. MB-3u-78]
MIGAVILTSPPWKAILPFINNFELSSGCLVSHFCRCFFNSLRNRNVTKAAEQLNIAKSAVSKRLASLEHKLGIKLINRTTRMSSITETGQRYYQRSKLILDEVEELNSQTSSSKRAFTGTLNIAVPLSFALGHLAPALDLFIQQHTDIKWNINFSVQKIDIVEQGVDSAFRGKT